jgi:hypothetical protein
LLVLFIQDYLIENLIAVFPQPVSSPGIVSADYYLFPIIESRFEGTRNPASRKSEK